MESFCNSPNLIRRILIDAMKTGQYANCRQLPSEKELAEKLNVSRTMLRDVLAALEREGLITRRHGVGTIINRISGYDKAKRVHSFGTLHPCFHRTGL